MERVGELRLDWSTSIQMNLYADDCPSAREEKHWKHHELKVLNL